MDNYLDFTRPWINYGGFFSTVPAIVLIKKHDPYYLPESMWYVFVITYSFMEGIFWAYFSTPLYVLYFVIIPLITSVLIASALYFKYGLIGKNPVHARFITNLKISHLADKIYCRFIESYT